MFISDEILSASGMSEKELTLGIIIMLFQQKRISIGKAAHLAQMPLIQFQHELAVRQIPLHYDVSDFETDLKNLEKSGQL
jgi:predicted HTH domain antitoxin